MKRSQKNPTQLFSGIFCFFWTTALLTAVFSGLSHLPFAVRYGLVQSDARATIWHYYAAAVLLMLGTYAVIIWWFGGRREFLFTRCGAIRTVLLILLSLSGLALMLHNLPDVALFGRFYTAIKFCHLFSGLLLVPVLLLQGALWLAGKPSSLKACATGSRRPSA